MQPTLPIRVQMDFPDRSIYPLYLQNRTRHLSIFQFPCMIRYLVCHMTCHYPLSPHYAGCLFREAAIRMLRHFRASGQDREVHIPECTYLRMSGTGKVVAIATVPLPGHSNVRGFAIRLYVCRQALCHMTGHRLSLQSVLILTGILAFTIIPQTKKSNELINQAKNITFYV